MLAAACSILCAPLAWSKAGSEPDLRSHFVSFPARKIGDIALVPASSDMFMALLSSKTSRAGSRVWTGEVPPQQMLFLFAGYDLACDTGKLKQFQPNDFVGISFYKMPLEDDGLKNIARLSGLQKLDLRYTDVTDAGLQEVAKLNNLICLDLTATLIKGSGLHSVTSMKSLEAIDLSKNKIRESCLKELTPMPRLRHLKVRRCDLTDKSFEFIDKMPALGELDVSENPHVTAKRLGTPSQGEKSCLPRRCRNRLAPRRSRSGKKHPESSLCIDRRTRLRQPRPRRMEQSHGRTHRFCCRSPTATTAFRSQSSARCIDW